MILLFHVCSGIRISSPFHLSTFQIPFQNCKSPQNAKNAGLSLHLSKVKRKLCRLWSVLSLHQQFLLQSMISMLLHLLTIPQMWIMFISKKSDLFQIIHIQEPWEPPQDVLGLCPPSDPSDCLSGLNMEGPQYSAPQRTFLAVEYLKKVGTYGRDSCWFLHSIPWSSPTLPQDNLVQRRHRSKTTEFRLHFR